MRNSLVGKPKNWLDGLYKGVKHHENLEVVKKEDITPKSPTEFVTKDICEGIKSKEIKEAVGFLKAKPKGKATWLTANGIYEIDYNYNPPRVTKVKEENARTDIYSRSKKSEE